MKSLVFYFDDEAKAAEVVILVLDAIHADQFFVFFYLVNLTLSIVVVWAEEINLCAIFVEEGYSVSLMISTITALNAFDFSVLIKEDHFVSSTLHALLVEEWRLVTV